MESVHPMVVHFPLALVTTGVLVDGAALAWHRPSWRRVGLANVALGTLGMGVAVLTGLQAERIAKHSFEIYQVMERHQRAGIGALILGLVTVAWRAAYRDQLTGAARASTTALSVALLVTLAYGAHLGGRLVYEFGVGGSFGQAAPHQRLP